MNTRLPYLYLLWWELEKHTRHYSGTSSPVDQQPTLPSRLLPRKTRGRYPSCCVSYPISLLDHSTSCPFFGGLVCLFFRLRWPQAKGQVAIILFQGKDALLCFSQCNKSVRSTALGDFVSTDFDYILIFAWRTGGLVGLLSVIDKP